MLKAIVVDDDRNVLNGLQKLIDWEALGYALVGVASTGRAGYELAVKHRVDVIISDIVMPEMDGMEFLRAVRQALGDVSFIFLSAYESFPAAQIAIELHVQSYILKPISREKLGVLSEELRKLRASRERSEYYDTLLYGHADELRRALCESDRAYFERLFARLMDDAMRMKEDTGLLRRTCMHLLSLMKEAWGGDFSPPAEADMSRSVSRTDLVIRTANACFDAIDRRDQAQPAASHPLIVWIGELISQGLSDPDLGTAAIARQLNYSSSYISRMFTRCTGVTLVEYITLRRMETAARLLAETSMSVTDIAVRVGFRNPNYFAKVFRKTFGCQPTEYRQQNAGKERK